MVQETAARFQANSWVSFGAPMAICAEAHKDLIERQFAMDGVTLAALALEPFGRNTAAAAYIAARMVEDAAEGELVLLLPADHVIADIDAFHEVISRASRVAQERIVTFGIKPDGPETGYGYIQSGAALVDGVHQVKRFAEKPNAQTATAYLAEGGYAWNAGIFLYSPQVLVSEMRKLAPDIARYAEAAYKGAEHRGASFVLDPVPFRLCPSQPFDIAVMEKTDLAAVAPCEMGWADVGSWSELWRLGPHDEKTNFSRGEAVFIDTSNSLVVSEGVPVAVIGLNNMIVVATDQGVIVLSMDRAQDVKAAVEALKARKAQPQ